MSLLGRPATIVRHQLLRMLSSVEHARNHREVRRHAAQDKERRRKAKLTWWRDEPRWYSGSTEPKQHNRVTPLIDGESFFTALEQALNEAEHYIYIIGWCLTPYIPLGRENGDALVRSRLLPLLSEVAGRVPVRVLLWSGAGALIQPTVKSVEAVQALFEKEGKSNLLCMLDRSAHPTHCHHQKAIVIDGRKAFVGGMDLTTFSGDRWDKSSHPLRAGQNWHDMQVLIEGETVADVEHNFRQRWHAVTDDTALPPARAANIEKQWQTPVQIARTVPSRVYDFAPDGEFGIHHFYVQALRRAKRLIYIENQYIWSPYVMKALIDAMNAPHSEPFRIVIILPAFAGDGRWDNDKHVAKLREADGGRGIVSIYSLYTSGPNLGEKPFTYRAIYLHAKVAVIDDEWLTVGSANLNNRGLVTDGEINAVVHDANLARRVRVALWAEHLGLHESEVAETSTLDLIDRVWPTQADENAAIMQQANRPLVSAVHSYIVGRRPSDLLLEDAQSLTFEH